MDEPTQTLIARERERREALVADDMARFYDLLAEDVVHVHTTGVVQGRAELLDHAGGFLRFLDIERGPLQVRLLSPDVAVMTGDMVNTVQRRGSDEQVRVEAFVTQVWVRRGEVWRIASFQATRKGGPPPGAPRA